MSTFALTILPQPAIPPTNQQEILAGTIQPIVSFTILGSILIRKLFDHYGETRHVYHSPQLVCSLNPVRLHFHS